MGSRSASRQDNSTMNNEPNVPSQPSLDCQAARTQLLHNAACLRGIGAGRRRNAHYNDLSVDLPAATLWQKVTHGITRILTGGERGTRTLDPGSMWWFHLDGMAWSTVKVPRLDRYAISPYLAVFMELWRNIPRTLTATSGVNSEIWRNRSLATTSRLLCDYLTVLPEVHRRAVHTRSLLRIFGCSTQCSADTGCEMIWLL